MTASADSNPDAPTAALWQQLSPRMQRAFHCRCARPVFFGNTRCLACHTELGYDADAACVVPIEPADGESGCWRRARNGNGDATREGRLYRRCSNRDSAAACSWLIAADEPGPAPSLTGVPSTDAPPRFDQCRSCRLNRTLPDLSKPANQALWARVEVEKQRLVASLIALELPVVSRTVEDPERGVAFDLLHGGESATPVMIGHADGIITLDIQEADDAHREAVRSSMDEAYRTVLGHLRHESGHYYWQRLVDGGAWIEPYRKLFGDERLDYAQALQRHHSEGPPADWQQSFVSAYASSHPWEDWAETWAHYLHITDTLDTALSFGIDASASGLLRDPIRPNALRRHVLKRSGDERQFLAFINAWVELTAALNELSRAMGGRDFYPFVLSTPAVAKLHFVHRVVNEAAGAAA